MINIGGVLLTNQSTENSEEHPEKNAHIIVLGNEKGGSGKSTTAMHIFAALAREGHTVGTLDLDVRQKSFFRYFDNREAFAKRKGLTLTMPVRHVLEPSRQTERTLIETEEQRRFEMVLNDLHKRCDFIIIDTPGSHSYYSRLGHAVADTLITPLNDSFVDFDLLAHIDPETRDIKEPSIYAEMVWDSRKIRAASGLPPARWIVMRNRLSMLDAKNKRRVGYMLQKLSERLGFHLLNGFSERVIFRELFLSGLTLLDLTDQDTAIKMTMSHVAARNEVRELLAQLNLPGFKNSTNPIQKPVSKPRKAKKADVAPET